MTSPEHGPSWPTKKDATRMITQEIEEIGRQMEQAPEGQREELMAKAMKLRKRKEEIEKEME